MGRGEKNSNVSLLEEAMYPDDFSLFIAIVAALPVFPVIFAAFKRKPEASDLIRKLWRNGRNFITVAAVMNIIILFVPFEHFSIYSFTRVDWIQLAIAVGIIYFMHTSQRVKDTFADFPENQ